MCAVDHGGQTGGSTMTANHLNRRRFLSISASAALVGASSSRASTPQVWRGYALGAEVSVTLNAPQEVAAPLFLQIEEKLKQMENLFSLFNPESAVSRLNTTGVLDAPDPEMFEILGIADDLHHITSGRFDPTVQPLWRALATDGNIAQARELLGWGRVRVTRQHITLGQDQALTLNGIAQGYATDQVAALLRRAGMQNVLVNIGEFAAIGGPWRLGVSDPIHGLVDVRIITNSAIATSSPAAMQLQAGTGHILNPRTPDSTPLWSTVSVQARTATLADGLSTALCFTTEDKCRDLLAKLDNVLQITLIAASGAKYDLV